MAIEIVDLPIHNGDFPVRYVKLPEGNFGRSQNNHYNIIANLGLEIFCHHYPRFDGQK